VDTSDQGRMQDRQQVAISDQTLTIEQIEIQDFQNLIDHQQDDTNDQNQMEDQ